MALTPKWTLCMGKEFIHRLAGHTVKPLLCNVSCGGFPDSRHIVNTQLQSLIWPVCRCKQKATLESKEKAFRTLCKITAPLDRQRSSLSNTFSCCAENHQAEFFCTGTLHRTKPTVDVVRARTGAVVLQGCLPWIQECTSCPLRLDNTVSNTCVWETFSTALCSVRIILYELSDTSRAPLVRSAAHCHKWSSEVLSQLLHTWCCQAAARWLPLLGGASCFLGSWDVGG